MRNRHVPPRTTGPVGAPPPPVDRDAQAKEELGRALREGFQKIADSFDNAMAGVSVTNAIQREVGRQERRWGVSSWPDGTGPTTHPIASVAGYVYADAVELMNAARIECDLAESNGAVTWWDILLEKVLKAAAERPDLDNEDLDKELVKAAGSIVSWVRDRNRRRLDQERRLADLAEHGYDRAEGPQMEAGNLAEGLEVTVTTTVDTEVTVSELVDNPDQAGALERAGIDPDELAAMDEEPS